MKTKRKGWYSTNIIYAKYLIWKHKLRKYESWLYPYDFFTDKDGFTFVRKGIGYKNPLKGWQVLIGSSAQEQRNAKHWSRR